MESIRWLDLVVICLYLAGVVAVGLRFARRQTSTESYFIARRSIPAWAMGLSLFATLISSVTFIAYPGSAYGGDWSNLTPGLMAIPVLLLVGLIIVPFYRSVVRMSAYEYFGKRFGYGARAFGSFVFALGHFSKMSFVFYLVALTVHSMTGWNMYAVTIVIAFVTVLYTYMGGLEAVIWTDVMQGIISFLGIFVVLGFLLIKPEGGPGAAFKLAWEHDKFSLGALNPDFTQKTFWVMTFYGIFWFLQKYTSDQTAVQRYLVTKTTPQAVKGATFGALLCIPVWTLFMLIGTLLWSFYQLSGEVLPEHIAKADQVFPYFLSTQIPAGLAGLFIAALFAAAMSTLSSDLNCLSLIGVEDYYRKLKPSSTDGERLRTGKVIVAVAGVLSLIMALFLAYYTKSALSLYFTFTAILSGGLFGLFFLAFLCRRATKHGVWVGILASVAFTGYATLTRGESRLIDLGVLNFKLAGVMIGVIGHVVLIVVGYVASLCLPSRGATGEDLTVWGWWETRKAGQTADAAARTLNQ